MKRSALVFLFVVFGLCACQPATQETTQPQILIDAPSISMGISGESCTSMEVQTGTQVTWTNDGTDTLRLRLTLLGESGNESEISESELGPGDSFSTQLPAAGNYRLYCSDDMYGTITVK